MVVYYQGKIHEKLIFIGMDKGWGTSSILDIIYLEQYDESKTMVVLEHALGDLGGYLGGDRDGSI